MKIELRKVSINQRMSEETPCYSADLYFCGVKVAEVANHGHGGPDMVDVVKGQQDMFNAAVGFIKAMPPVPSGYEGIADLQMDLELWCHLEVGRVEDQKTVLRALRKDLKSAVVYVRDGGIYVTRYKGVKQITPRHIEHFRAARPEITTILNGMPESQALAIYAPLVEARS